MCNMFTEEVLDQCLPVTENSFSTTVSAINLDGGSRLNAYPNDSAELCLCRMPRATLRITR